MKIKLLFLALYLSLSRDAHAQICNMSHYPYGWGMMNRPIMHGSEFKSALQDLPFIEAERGKSTRYSQFWVTADVLNIRSGPSLEHEVISETYFGNLVFALAKEGNWVAIRSGHTVDDIDVLPRWVHIKYLSSTRINEQVDIELLKRKCSFVAQGTYIKSIKDWSVRISNGYHPCKAISSYLTHQRLLGSRHAYELEYRKWRQSQSNPDNYSQVGC